MNEDTEPIHVEWVEPTQLDRIESMLKKLVGWVEDARKAKVTATKSAYPCCILGCDAPVTLFVKRPGGGEHRYYCQEHFKAEQQEHPFRWVVLVDISVSPQPSPTQTANPPDPQPPASQ